MIREMDVPWGICIASKGKDSKLREMRAERMKHSDMGNARLYAKLYRDRHAHSVTSRDWLFYDGIKWKADPCWMEAEKDARLLSDALKQYTREVDMDGDGMFK